MTTAILKVSNRSAETEPHLTTKKFICVILYTCNKIPKSSVVLLDDAVAS